LRGDEALRQATVRCAVKKPFSHHLLTAISRPFHRRYLASRGTVNRMKRSRNLPRSSPRPTSRPPAFELPPERAFVLHLDARAQPPRHVLGRIEHVTTGRVAHITSLRELVTFLANVLHNRAGATRSRGTQLSKKKQRATSAISITASRDSRIHKERES
jgi:hypothetical protein